MLGGVFALLATFCGPALSGTIWLSGSRLIRHPITAAKATFLHTGAGRAQLNANWDLNWASIAERREQVLQCRFVQQ